MKTARAQDNLLLSSLTCFSMIVGLIIGLVIDKKSKTKDKKIRMGK